jgi:hypothetical protein
VTYPCSVGLLHCCIALLLYCFAAARYAVGTRGWLTFQGGWAWTLKDYIDRAFMDKYGTALPFDKVMSMNASSTASNSSSALGWLFGSSSSSITQQQQHLPGAFAAAGIEGAELFAASAMRCGGCGAKVGSSTLSRVLKRIKTQQRQHQQQQQQQGVSSSLEAAPAVSSAAAAAGAAAAGAAAAAAASDGLLQQVQLGADDAAVLAPPPPGHLLVSTVDFFRAFWPDAYLLGTIAANHALGVGAQSMAQALCHMSLQSFAKLNCMYSSIRSCRTISYTGCTCVRILHMASRMFVDTGCALHASCDFRACVCCFAGLLRNEL